MLTHASSYGNLVQSLWLAAVTLDPSVVHGLDADVALRVLLACNIPPPHAPIILHLVNEARLHGVRGLLGLPLVNTVRVVPGF